MSSKHEVAVSHILNRVIIDRNFSWEMARTETLNLCLQAEAERTGKTVEECEAWLYKRMRLENERLRILGKDVAEVQILKKKLKSIKNQMKRKINDLHLWELSHPKCSDIHYLTPLEYLEATALP